MFDSCVNLPSLYQLSAGIQAVKAKVKNGVNALITASNLVPPGNVKSNQAVNKSMTSYNNNNNLLWIYHWFLIVY